VLRPLEIPTDFILAPVEVDAQLHKKSALAYAFAGGKFKERVVAVCRCGRQVATRAVGAVMLPV